MCVWGGVVVFFLISGFFFYFVSYVSYFGYVLFDRPPFADFFFAFKRFKSSCGFRNRILNIDDGE